MEEMTIEEMLAADFAREIEGYEGLYAVTRDGRVWSFRSKKFLKPRENYKGYLLVCLCGKEKNKHAQIHRLVAEAFIPNLNPEEKTQVNHLDENKKHNYVENLDWVSPKENANYGTRNKRSSEKQGYPVYCYNNNTVYPSAQEAAKQLGLYQSEVSSCCRKEFCQTHGYYFCLAEEKDTFIPQKSKSAPKAVFCVELNKIFRSAAAAAREVGVHNAHIGACCRGERHIAGGYHWRYPTKEDYNTAEQPSSPPSWWGSSRPSLRNQLAGPSCSSFS